ncbi:MAG: hypothetical protein KF785_10870 [Gemmatimonadales bacterium]|nr:hypothetical protein [Gemmatimonadales bacterium]
MVIDPDQDFDPTEELYLRLSLERRPTQSAIKKAIAEQVHFPKCSVNRGKYSEPYDVVRLKPGWSVGVFEVRDIPASLECKVQGLYEFFVFHCPEADTDGVMNYAHSEIRSRFDGNLRQPGRLVKFEFRELIAFRMKVLPPL